MPLPPSPAAPAPLHPPTWPLVLRPSLAWRLLVGGLGAALALGGLGGAAWVVLRPPGADATLLALVALGLALLGLACVAVVLVGRIVLHPHAIEVVELGRGRNAFRRDEIAGRRLVPLQHGMAQLVLELRGQDRRPFKATLLGAADPALVAWLAPIPDLDALDLARAEAELLRAPALGADEGERRAALAAAVRVAWGARLLALAVATWGFLWPRPYPAAVAALAAVPLLALGVVLAGRGRYGLEGRRDDPRPEMLTPVLVPGVVLMLRALTDVNLLDHQPVLAWTALGALALGALLPLADATLRRRWWAVPLLGLMLAPLAWGALVEADVLLDHRPAEVFPALVTGKQVVSGKVTRYQLRLDPWGPVAAADEVEVDPALHAAVAAGDTVCVTLRPGALGARWFLVDRCR